MRIGEWVEAPDWDPIPRCGGGIHGLLEARGDWMLLHGAWWQVYEVSPDDVVRIDNEKAKFRSGRLVYFGNGEDQELLSFFDWKRFDSKTAYWWAYKIGDKEVMRDRVIDSEWAYRWARDIGDREIMRDRITESKWAYYWARNIGDPEIMRKRITNQRLIKLGIIKGLWRE